MLTQAEVIRRLGHLLIAHADTISEASSLDGLRLGPESLDLVKILLETKVLVAAGKDNHFRVYPELKRFLDIFGNKELLFERHGQVAEAVERINDLIRQYWEATHEDVAEFDEELASELRLSLVQETMSVKIVLERQISTFKRQAQESYGKGKSEAVLNRRRANAWRIAQNSGEELGLVNSLISYDPKKQPFLQSGGDYMDEVYHEMRGIVGDVGALVSGYADAVKMLRQFINMRRELSRDAQLFRDVAKQFKDGEINLDLLIKEPERIKNHNVAHWFHAPDPTPDLSFPCLIRERQSIGDERFYEVVASRMRPFRLAPVASNEDKGPAVLKVRPPRPSQNPALTPAQREVLEKVEAILDDQEQMPRVLFEFFAKAMFQEVVASKATKEQPLSLCHWAAGLEVAIDTNRFASRIMELANGDRWPSLIYFELNKQASPAPVRNTTITDLLFWTQS